VHFRIIGTEKDLDYPTRPHLIFAGEVRDGQTMWGRVEMTQDGHLRWKWVRLRVTRRAMQFTRTLSGMRRGRSNTMEVYIHLLRICCC
jgi:hypothetical protein